MALQNKGQTIELQLLHRRPLNVKDRAVQTTPDKVLRLRANASGKLEINEVAHGKTPKESTQRFGASPTNLAKAAEALDTLARNYEMKGRIASPNPPSRLPGPRSTSQLTRAQRELIGVARWPDPTLNSESSAANKKYGLDFCESTRKAGSLLANGELGGFRQLWHYAAEWRFSKIATPHQEATPFGKASPFKPQGPRSNRGSSQTPISGPYGFMAERLNGRKHDFLRPILPIEGGPKERVFASSDKIGGQTIELTTLTLSDTLDPAIATNLRRIGMPVGNRMNHTPTENIDTIVEHLETLFTHVTNGRNTPQEALKGLAEMHWWAAHAMPDERGSAAKAEFCIRSMANAMGMELPPFKRGIIPDLEAFMTPRADFVRNYASMFDGNVLSHERNNS